MDIKPTHRATCCKELTASPVLKVLLHPLRLSLYLCILVLISNLPARAQSLCPNGVTSVCAIANQGASSANGSDHAPFGNSAGPASAPASIVLNLASNTNWILSSPQFLLSTTTAGGNGGNGGNALEAPGNPGGNGGDGGSGGYGGNQSLEIGSPSILKNTGTGSAVLMSSSGGNGGSGGQPDKPGNGGEAAPGGNGGNLSLTFGASVAPQAITSVSVLTPGASGGSGTSLIELQSVGGNGGNGGDNSTATTGSVYGRNGANAGDGGNITVSGAVSLNSNEGSGLVAISQGALAGNGGVANSDFGTAYGGNGGTGGAGGEVVVGLANDSSITATGAKVSGTGKALTLDAYLNGQWTTSKGTTSYLTVGVAAESFGGAGGLGNMSSNKGGSGGAAGDAGEASIAMSDTSIRTLQSAAVGALSMSVGGAGGSGSAGGGTFSRDGGSGGAGGDGGIADISISRSTNLSAQSIQTKGKDSDAFVALSVGGGGGYGGQVVGGGAGITLTLGGQGGQGGNGGQVNVANGAWVQPEDGGADYSLGGDVIATDGRYARGVVAQSIGGGGGRGGDASGDGIGPLTLSIGGIGAQGGDGGEVGVSNLGIIQTTGNHSTGVFAQSVGGGGGSGGAATSLDIGAFFTASLAIGGTGGKGGIGQQVSVTNFGQIITAGSDAYGIVAQSVGGGGGQGGTSVADSLALNPPDTPIPSLTLTASIGGIGGSGGAGGNVTLLNAGLINTSGVGAGGIFAQSVGGGGGMGGDSSATSYASEQSSLTITTAIGGHGGSGGIGGTVVVENSGFVSTLADMAPGVSAQSVGGGGGTGGFGRSHTSSISDAGPQSMDLTLSIGGSGGQGGNGGAVTVENFINPANNPISGAGSSSLLGAGGILTQGDGSDGVFAQSVGGGGGLGKGDVDQGSGGTITVKVGLGGNGGDGGNGGLVTVENGTGAIVTTGANSAGIFAQSIGGGGGKGGGGAKSGNSDPKASFSTYLGNQMATDTGTSTAPVKVPGVDDTIYNWQASVTGAFSAASDLSKIAAGYNKFNSSTDVIADTDSSTSFSVNVGAGLTGSGGAAGNGGAVNASNLSGSIVTSGPESAGISAQSIGGGGGVGGASNPGVSDAHLSSTSVKGTITVGGAHGSDGDGGSVQVDNAGTITTSGDLSQGILAQSIGGGGGNGSVTALASAANTNVTVSLGGSTGSSGNGGAVTVVSTNAITTTGNDSVGIMAQSIGGGGGITALLGATFDANGKMTSGTGLLPSGSTINTYFAGGANIGDLQGLSNGGLVNVTLTSGGTISTSGLNSYGILAQSIGGGGGVIVAGQSSVGSADVFLSAAQGSEGAFGGNVLVNTSTNTKIQTSGAGAVGILAQSIGGGGGIINGMASVIVGRNVANAQDSHEQTGQGGNVIINNSSDIDTTGVNASGIFAESVGGGGGVIGRIGGPVGYLFAGAQSYQVCGGATACTGDVTVNLNSGTIRASGAGSAGVYMFSRGNGSNHTTLNMDGGVIETFSNAGAAVFLAGADANTVNNLGGTIDSSQSVENIAIASASSDQVTITNGAKGTITGSITTGAGSTFNNQVGGSFNPGPIVNLGPTGVFTNNGTLNVGSSGKIGSSVLTGNFVQGMSGVLVIDANLATGQADTLTVNGSADVSGVVRVVPTVLAKQGPLTVLSASNGLTFQGTAVGLVETPIFSVTTAKVGNTLQIQSNADFITLADDLGSSQRAVAAHLQQVWDSGSSMNGGFSTLEGVHDGASYASDLNSLSGQTLGAIAAVRYQSAQNFVSNMYVGCPMLDDSGGISEDTSCSWGRFMDSHSRRNMTNDVLGYEANAQSVQVGSQKEVAPSFFIGGSVAYEWSDLHGNAHSSDVDGKSALAGLSARYRVGAWEFSGALDAGHGWYDTTRYVSIGTLMSSATASPTLWNAGVDLRLAYEADRTHWYAKPFVDLHSLYLHSDAYTEAGAGAFDLAVSRQGNVALAASGGIEVGGKFKLMNRATLRPFISAAGEYLSNSAWAAQARFVDEAGSAGFKVSTPLPDALARFALGVELLGNSNWDVRVQYNPEFGRDYVSQMGAIKFDVRF